MGAFCVGARSADVLYSVHHVARTAPLAFRYEFSTALMFIRARASPSSYLPSSLRSDVHACSSVILISAARTALIEFNPQAPANESATSASSLVPFTCAHHGQDHTPILRSISGINVQSLTQMACDARMMDADARAATVQTIAGHMEDALEIQREVGD